MTNLFSPLLYRNKLKNRFLSCAKAPKIEDRKWWYCIGFILSHLQSSICRLLSRSLKTDSSVYFGILALFCFASSFVHGDIENYFKKPLHKSDGHTIKNIDFIYMLNLDERPEKFAITSQRFLPYGIIPYRFSAVNGWKLPLTTFEDVGVKYGPWLTGGGWGTCYPADGDGSPQHEIIQKPGKTYFSHCMSRGAIAIVLSHLSILQDAYDSGYETIWVLEDDVEILQNPHILSDLIEELDALVGKDHWDILFTDKDTRNKLGQYVPCTDYARRPNYSPDDPLRFGVEKQIGSHFRQVGARFGAYSMIVRRSGMEKLLKFFKNYQIFLPFDIDFTQPNDIRLYTVLDDIVIPWSDAPTDNGNPNYTSP